MARTSPGAVARSEKAVARAEGREAAGEAKRPEVPGGPFTTRQLLRIDEALAAADRETGLTFSVYVGPLDEGTTREHAERLHDRIAGHEAAVLLAVSPNQRVLEIVTGEQSDKRLPRQACALAALSMTASFGGGDLAGGIVTGLRMLTDQAT
ncbi:MAG: DUF5130 family protein [Micromonosporaceae bacterium]